MEKDIKVLIIGSTPYSSSLQTRSFETYLNKWKGKSFLIRQIYTRPLEPSFEYCDSYYQLTDKMILKSLFCSKKRGVIYNSDTNTKESNSNESNLDLSTGYLFASISKKKTPFIRLVRGALWGKRRWQSKKLLEWIDEFSPDIVFMNFGDDFHLFRMSNFVAEKYNIPIITVISDDYYFSLLNSKNIFSIIYRKKYLKLLKGFLCNERNAVAFNSQKILDKYVNYFGIKHYDLVSVSYSESFSNLRNEIETKSDKTVISYFGNFEYGRYKSIIQLADSFSDNFKFKICGTCKDNKVIESISNHPHIEYLGVVPYSETIKIAKESDYLLVAESFDEKDAKDVEYALSTKVADFLSSGIPIIAIGSKNAGAIEYLKENSAAIVCVDNDKLKELVDNLDSCNKHIVVDNALKLAKANHNLEINGDKFYKLCETVVKGDK